MRARGIIFRLSRADLWDEWVLTICLVMAVAAVLSPLLILFGLKFGTIETLRHRLVQDPRNREIRPMVSKIFNQDWFQQMAQRSDVAFVIPMTRQISASLDASMANGESAEKVTLDLIPTLEGDPLVLENGAPIPGTAQCVLSHAAAEALGAKPGDNLTGYARRLAGARYEAGNLSLQVVGVLDPRAGGLKAIFVPLEVLEAVEHYKDGQSVPEYGWSGAAPLAYPVYDGVVALIPDLLSPTDEFKLISGTGFTRIERLSPEEFRQSLGFDATSDRFIYSLHTTQRAVTRDSVAAVKLKLRGRSAVVAPWVKDMQAELVDRSGEGSVALTLHSAPVSPEDLGGFPAVPLMSWDDDQGGPGRARRILLPESIQSLMPSGFLQVRRGEEVLRFPVEVLPGRAPGSQAIIPVALAGILNLFMERNLTYNPTDHQFLLHRRGYAGFRLYAATIDDVDRLRHELEASGIPVHTEAQRIRDVMELDRYLTLLFLLIAFVGISGGIGALTASLYASVQRKRKELSVLRLIGFSGATLFRFPVYQGILIGCAGFWVAMGFFFLTAKTINTLFRSHLHGQESFCRLSVYHIVLALVGTVVLAGLSSSAAAWRVTRLDPAEALRDE
jgi:putative ABC transport system permease protein